MRIAATTTFPYSLPLCQPWPGAGLDGGTRNGWLLRIDTADGNCGFGECAPLPSHGSETAAAAATALQDWCASLPGRDVDEVLSTLAGDSASFAAPAARAAVECALLDLAARVAGVPLRRLLSPAAGDSVAVNAMAGDLVTATPPRLSELLAKGFTTIKLKLGAADTGADTATEIAALRALAETLPPAVRLRLDANRAWDTASATRICAALAELPVEALEEPLAAPTLAALATLQRGQPFALAVDESWRELAGGDAEAFFSAAPVRRLVLKPAVLGGLRPALATARRARAAGMECVVTTGVDGACATLAAAQLAAAIDGAGEIDHSPAHGLATSAWLAADIGVPPVVVGGRIALPPEAGLGFTPAACFPACR